MKVGRFGFKSVFTAAVILCGAMAAAPVEATTISFSSVGTIGGFPVSGTADFDIGLTGFSVTLTNTIVDPGKVPQMLDGLNFTMTGGSGSPVLQNVTAAGAINCATPGGVFPCPADTSGVTSPFGWTAPTTAGATFLSAGDGAFHDYAIINSSYTSGSIGNGGLGNNGHNPLLIGPVTFFFSGAFTGVKDVSLLWGTEGEPTGTLCTTCSPGGHDGDSVPEPASMLLLGTGLLGVGAATRRRFFGKK